MGYVHAERVESVRRMMDANGWDAVVILGSDPHSSEYPAPRWQAVEWISGFTGEAGDVVITRDHAGLWTDSRYFIQANNQLKDSGIELHKTRQPDSVPIPQWLAAAGVRSVAVDGLTTPAVTVREIKDSIAVTVREVADSVSVAVVPDLLAPLWTDRPPVPETPVITLDEELVGESRMSKLVWLRKFLMAEGCDAIFLSSLDEIAWLLNVRGTDIEYNPYVISYLYVSLDQAVWFVRKRELSSGKEDPDTLDSFAELQADGVEIESYYEVDKILAQAAESGDERIFVDISTLNEQIYSSVNTYFGDDGMHVGTSPVQLRKAVKNAREVEALHEASLEDGAAMERFLYWLDTEVSTGRVVTEWEASVKLDEFRSGIEGYRGNSFETISAYGANAALPHYSTPEEGSAVIQPRGLYLVDSGGQYFFGTTDITRTVPMGDCTDLEKEDYTLVLKGMIRLAMAVFPKGTPGCLLDVLARDGLWRSRRNFGHGTGHGIGFYLGVHEGPQSIRQNLNPQPLVPGMVTSDEPGIYREGRHGVRHENMLLCVEDGRNEFGEWLRFETLTLCHIDTSAVVWDLLDSDEIRWLEDYNALVVRRLSPLLPGEIVDWIRFRTAIPEKFAKF